jgi:hypothetical protein
LPEREFSEENQEVAMKHESQLLFRIHLLFVGFPAFFHDYRDSHPFGKQPKGSVMMATRTRILATV